MIYNGGQAFEVWRIEQYIKKSTSEAAELDFQTFSSLNMFVRSVVGSFCVQLDLLVIKFHESKQLQAYFTRVFSVTNMWAYSKFEKLYKNDIWLARMNLV